MRSFWSQIDQETENEMMGVRVRYAPSPTGALHLGGARTALFNYAFAKKHGGSFVIRIEDTDQARHTEAGIDSQFDGLRWLGISWDESIDTPEAPYGPYRQMDRLPLYAKAIAQCIASGHAYYCYCTEEERARDREAQEARGCTPKYAGPCRDASPEDVQKWQSAQRKRVVRWRVPEHKTFAINDLIRGSVQWESADIGDWVIARADGVPTYNFAVVVDDIAMRISHVIRGEEHISNTPRQLMVYEALQATPPQFAHLPLILNDQRKKMSKRDASIVQFIDQYRALGYAPEALTNMLALLGWAPDNDQELFSLDAFVSSFCIDRIHKNGAVFDPAKLYWMNNHYMRTLPLEETTARIAPLVAHLVRIGEANEGTALPVVRTHAWLCACVDLHVEPMRYGAELEQWMRPLLPGVVQASEEAQEAIRAGRDVIGACSEALQYVQTWEASDIAKALKNINTSKKGKQLFVPIRAAVTGTIHGRDLARTIALIGRETVLERLHAAHTVLYSSHTDQ
jgi:nondiscriminating glutamyl-tRNA synthetase